MRKFWKNVNARFKIGLIITLIFLVIGFVVYYFPHVNPFTYNSYPKKPNATTSSPSFAL